MHVPDDITSLDVAHMRRALQLAERGRGRTSPNPMVGCVLVAKGRVVGEGWHRRAGEPHAEAEALRDAGEAARGATAYVTLEPCNHHGRTPPCSEALLDAGVARVVIAALDPNPRARGGAQRLREAGITVTTGVLEDEALEQNAAFFTNQLHGRPSVLYKTAMSLDGKVALPDGPARWITGEAARALVHEWRDQHDAIAVGVGTVLADDPTLTTRRQQEGTGRTPVKVVFDSQVRTPPTAKLFEPGPDGQPARVFVVAAEGGGVREGGAAPAGTAIGEPTDAVEPGRRTRIVALEARGAEVLVAPAPAGRPDLRAALEALLARGVTSVLLEGGGTLAWAFFASRLVDRVAWFVAPKLIGGAGTPGPLAGPGANSIEDAVRLERVSTRQVGDDLLITGRPRYPEADHT